MENSTVPWLSEMGMEDSTFMPHYQMDFLDDFSLAFGEEFKHSSSCESLSSQPSLNPCSNTSTVSHSSVEQEDSQNCVERPTKQLKTTEASSSSPKMLCFGVSSSPTVYRNAIDVKPNTISQITYLNQNSEVKICQGIKKASIPSSKSSYTHDHVIAERKRREKLSQRFITLTTMVPGLKKMDKASVLGDSIKYLKQLQDRVKILEEETSKQTMESVVLVKNVQVHSASSTDENLKDSADEQFPQIDAKFSDKDVLLRIHCKTHKGILMKTLAEIEKLNLSIVNSSVIPFASSTIHMTVTAQMEEEFDMTVKDLVQTLHSAFQSM